MAADNPFMETVQTLQANRASVQLARQYFQTQPGMVTEQAAITRAVSEATGTSVQDIGKFANRASRMAMQHGIDPSFGLRIAQSNAAFRSAWNANENNMGFGGLTSERAGRLDQELRLAAARSPAANAMGAVYAMAEAGIIDKGLIAKMDFSRGSAGVMGVLQREGVDMKVAGQFMNATRANQEQVAKHGLQDEVRKLQKDEINNMLGRDIATNLVGGFRREGMNRHEARAAASEAGQAIMGRLSDIAANSPDTMKDQGQLLDAMMEGAPEGMTRERMAGVLQAMRDKVMSDPNLSKFGNLQSLLAMNAKAREGGDDMMKDAREEAEEIRDAHEAAQEARPGQVAQLRKDLGIAEGVTGEALLKNLQEEKRFLEEGEGPLEDKERTKKLEQIDQLKQLEEAGDIQRGPAAAGRGPDGDPQGGDGAGGGVMRITGSLTLLEDGTGRLEGQAQGAAPGGE